MPRLKGLENPEGKRDQEGGGAQEIAGQEVGQEKPPLDSTGVTAEREKTGMKAREHFLQFMDERDILAHTTNPDEIWNLLANIKQENFHVPTNFLYAVSNPEIFLVKSGPTPRLTMYIIGQISPEEAFKLGADKSEIESCEFFDDGSVWFQSKSGGWLV